MIIRTTLLMMNSTLKKPPADTKMSMSEVTYLSISRMFGEMRKNIAN